jgi:dedicated sortase system histidine kinase
LRYVQEVEDALRVGLEQSLLARATTVAAALEGQALLCAAPRCEARRQDGATPIYAAPLNAEPRVDGALDDWNIADGSGVEMAGGHRVWSGVFGRYAYLFVVVADQDLVYQRLPGQMPFGARVVIATQPVPGLTRWVLLATGAPGVFRAQETLPERFEPSEAYDARLLGAWQETATGFSVELRVPLNLIGAALGVGVIDVDRRNAEYVADLSATWDSATGAPGRFIYQRPELQALLGQFGRAGGRFRVLDADGWVLSGVGSVDPRPTDVNSGSLIGGLFRWLLRRDDPPYPPERPAGRVVDTALRQALDGRMATAWYGSGPDREAIVAAAVPIAGASGPLGAVLLERASDPILTLTNQARVRLMSLTLVASMVVGAGLLGYATWLSLRVRRLAQAAENALGPRGEIRTGIPGVAARDEIGALARSFTHLLERLREHTEYLRTLASKLSHELRTPLAVMTTSLDNLEHEVKAPAAETYLARLRQGAQRLDATLAAMSEAAQLERAIKDTAAVPLDLRAVVESCCAAYRDIYPDRQIALAVTAASTQVIGSGDLVAQLLDKLVDNAVSFSPPGSRIDVELVQLAGQLVLSVTNRGSTLPVHMRDQLFGSLVSIREKSDGRPHLGLGLHIVALIAEFHGGRAEASDLADGSGVVFRVYLPRTAAGR